MHIVVVGASLAGVRTVQLLRRRGSDARITLVGAEPTVACDRPPLSKGFLADPAAALRSEDAVIAQLATADVAQRRARLSAALAGFDSATVATLHEFCRQVLTSLGTAADVDARVGEALEHQSSGCAGRLRAS